MNRQAAELLALSMGKAPRIVSTYAAETLKGWCVKATINSPNAGWVVHETFDSVAAWETYTGPKVPKLSVALNDENYGMPCEGIPISPTLLHPAAFPRWEYDTAVIPAVHTEEGSPIPENWKDGWEIVTAQLHEGRPDCADPPRWYVLLKRRLP